MRRTGRVALIYRQTRTISDVTARIEAESTTINSSALTLGGGGGGTSISQYSVQTLSENVVSSNVDANLSTPTVIATYPIPTGMKGKTGFLQGYFYIRNQTPWGSNISFNYGFGMDETLLGTTNGFHPIYRHTSTTDQYAIVGSNTVPGTGGFTGPVTIPVSVPSQASNFTAVIRNIPLPLTTTQLGEVTTTTFTGNGTIRTYTVPANITRIRVYLWGAGGLGQNAVPDTNPTTSRGSGGSGAYVSGVISVSPGQVLYLIIGRTTTSTPSLVAGLGGRSTDIGMSGGGFTGIFSANITGFSASQAAPALIACAGGGGSGGSNSSSATGGGGGVTAGKNAPNGGTGGTQTAGGTGSGGTGALLTGASGGGSGGGGGYYGGGASGGGNPTNGGGGGSSFIGGLTDVVSEDGATPASNNVGVYAEPGGASTMRSFFGATAWYGASGFSGAAVIVTQGTYPTYVGSEVNVIY